MKALVLYVHSNQDSSVSVKTHFVDDSTDTFVDVLDASVEFGTDVNTYTQEEFRTEFEEKILAYAVQESYPVTAADIVWLANPATILPSVFANPTRTLNSAFQISTTRDALVSYAVDIAATITVSGGATGTVFLEYADNSGFTTNVVEVNRTVNGNTGTLIVGLALTQNATGTLAGVIPAGKYVRIRTANTSGTPTFTFRRAQEVLV